MQGVIKGVVGGVFGSAAQMTGSLYEILKESTGQRVPKMRQVDHLPRGIYLGMRGLVKEIYLAI